MKPRSVSASRINSARLGANMSQADLAFALRQRLPKLRATERSVRRWEAGANVPHADVVPAIADATGVTIDFLYASASDDDEEAAPAVTLDAFLQQRIAVGVREALAQRDLEASA